MALADPLFRLLSGAAAAAPLVAFGATALLLTRASWPLLAGSGLPASVLDSLETSLGLVGRASLFGLPAGVLAGLYLAEHGSSPLGRLVRLGSEWLDALPPLLVGLAIVLLAGAAGAPLSRWAAALALSLRLAPDAGRATERALSLLPPDLREAALALGLPRWRVSLLVLLRTAWVEVARGLLRSLGRTAGETAPLLLVWSLGSPPPQSPPLPLAVYEAARTGSAAAAPAALALLALVLSFHALARLLPGEKQGGR